MLYGVTGAYASKLYINQDYILAIPMSQSSIFMKFVLKAQCDKSNDKVTSNDELFSGCVTVESPSRRDDIVDGRLKMCS